MTDAAPTPSPAEQPQIFNPPPQFFAALGHPTRIWIVQRLMRGVEMTSTQLAAEWKRGYDALNDHFKILHKAGIISARRGEDRRVNIYFIPEQYRREPGILDFGWCRFRAR